MATQKELIRELYIIHEHLRAMRVSSNTDEDYEAQWKRHTNDSCTLKKYSSTMYKLATEIWRPKNTQSEHSTQKVECRIEWVVSKIKSYFIDQLVTDDSHERKIKLLDVGSCYNPFSSIDDRDLFEITALDLCPAPGFERQIYQCDFLELNILSKSESDFSYSPNDVVKNKSNNKYSITRLPSSSFDVAVFSFFLEYLPDSKQRMKCCEKAWKLLRPGGLLFILRPDSNKVTPWGSILYIKKLLVGLNLIGFKRIFFEKLTHLWAIGCVKLTKEESDEYKLSKRFEKDIAKVSYTRIEELFEIPQDVKERERYKKSCDNSASASTNEPIFAEPQLFDFLPRVVVDENEED